jgi:hypothetical protein
MNPIDLQWTEHPDNPLISPTPPGLFIADPTVLLPEETPDGKWHLFANSIPPRIHEFVSSDGVSWSRIRTFARGGMRAYVRHFEGCFHLFYEQIRWPVPLRSRIVHCTSVDLKTWSKPAEVIRPHLSWHGRFHRTVGNPCVVRWGNEWLLYYSAATVFLKDCGFVEPAYIGLARSNCLNGPWTVMKSPLLSPDSGDSFRNMGAGAIKVIGDEEQGVLWGFNNGIFRDRENRSRSAIRVLRSLDGANWEYADNEPFVFPEPGWKRALVYAMDVRRVKDELWVYFNARDGWMVGHERIGLSVGRPVA